MLHYKDSRFQSFGPNEGLANEFVGSVLEGRPSYYAHSTVYACPTTKASFGITLLEAMACETPIVCSDILGFRDVVKHGREALMVPSGDRGAIADGLVRFGVRRARKRRSFNSPRASLQGSSIGKGRPGPGSTQSRI